MADVKGDVITDKDAGEEAGTETVQATDGVLADTGDETTAPETGPSAESGGAARSRQVSLSVRTLMVGALVVILAVGLGVTTWLYLGERSQVQTSVTAADNQERAEQISLDYAVNAAAMNFQDMNGWKSKLVAGTSPELTDKLSKAAGSMEQLLVPLQWTSTSEPLAAKVRSDTNGVYVVDTFVSVLTKTTQAPDNLQSTATYSITIDSNNNWAITDVGGIGAVVGGR